ncbi:hypothetical protein KUH03_17285 [Sphingobacterium sp. E70]|uniref:hypothetical protein n=1 Tax=Sphingobacterium sp. E70 TaxID=2853439 RepID=UPI00211CBD7D|nr:hypothetical protein [Sphingobacterium sp. E70]ULT28189.1 hypothetical protein KUH03_17285 [Sphingobacterium sp. E70]
MKRSKWIIVVVLALCLGALSVKYGQKILNKNKYKRIKTEYVFTDLINLGCTSVKQQGATNTCWSYTGNSFLESEMIRMGKEPVEISQVFTARQAYLDKAHNYVRLHGGLTMGKGAIT